MDTVSLSSPTQEIPHYLEGMAEIPDVRPSADHTDSKSS